MATCFVICMASEDEDDHNLVLLSVATTEAMAEKELRRQAEANQAERGVHDGYRHDLLIACPRLIWVGGFQFYILEIPFAG